MQVESSINGNNLITVGEIAGQMIKRNLAMSKIQSNPIYPSLVVYHLI